jgi:hypothetical protein
MHFGVLLFAILLILAMDGWSEAKAREPRA